MDFTEQMAVVTKQGHDEKQPQAEDRAHKSTHFDVSATLPFS